MGGDLALNGHRESEKGLELSDGLRLRGRLKQGIINFLSHC
jgi:hypothetical protein